MIFGFPFLPSIIFQLIIDFSDRQMLAHITDLKTVGLYSSSYKIASIMLLLISGFRLGWEPFFLKLKNNKSLIISSVSNFVMFFLITVLLFIILFIEPIIIYSNHILPFSIIGENFWSSLPIIPIIMFGYLFLALYHLQMPGIFYYNKTFFLPFFRFLGALSNVLLNLILIPCWGIYGAAIATSLSFAIMTMPMFIYTNRLFQIKYNWLFICLYLLYALFVYSLNSFYIITIIPAILLFSVGLFIILCQLKKTRYLLLNYL
jgi:O-antigen/teichoic acid export membrane protein